MEKRRFESFEVFSCLNKVNPRILSTFKDRSLKNSEKTPSSDIIHSLGGEYCWIVQDSEPIRLFKSPRSLSVYILSLDCMFKVLTVHWHIHLFHYTSCRVASTTGVKSSICLVNWTKGKISRVCFSSSYVTIMYPLHIRVWYSCCRTLQIN